MKLKMHDSTVVIDAMLYPRLILYPIVEHRVLFHLKLLTVALGFSGEEKL